MKTPAIIVSLEAQLEQAAKTAGVVVLDRSLVQQLRDYVAEGVAATIQCREELPGYSEKSDHHLARQEAFLAQLDASLSDATGERGDE